MNRNVGNFALAILAIGLFAAAPAQDDSEVYGDGYGEGNFGRVRYLENGATFLRAGPEGGERFGDGEPAANSPVFPGDAIRTGRDQRVEVELASGSILRLDRDGEIAFQALPRPGAAYRDNTILSLAVGALRVTSRELDDEDFRIDTPSSSVYVLGEADVRVDVDRSGATRVFSRRGVAEVVGEGGSVLVRGGTRTVVEPGAMPLDPRAWSTLAGDGFDSWCNARDREYAWRAGTATGLDTGSYEELPYEVRPYYGELSAHGSWVRVPTYGLVWYPSGVGPRWRPYWDGYWGYGPSGYFWIASEPWGWAPYHYGRWSWVAGYGWCWIPGSVFAGAWVSWSWGSLYVGWAALDFWDYPCVGGVSFVGYYDPYCWTFVRYDRFAYYRPYPRYAVPVSSVLPSHGGAAIVTRPPRVSPRDFATSPEARRRATRQASEDRAARLPESRASYRRTDDRRFVETERRAIRERGNSADPTSVRRDRERREAPAGTPPRTSAPAARRSAESDDPGARGGSAPRRRSADAARSPVGAAGRGDPRPSASPSEKREGAAGTEAAGARTGQGRDATGGFPRRYERDPAADGRREIRKQEPAGSTAREDRSPTRDQLRNMYDRYSSPRETRPRQDAGEVRPSRAPEGSSGTAREARPRQPSVPTAQPRQPGRQPQRASPPSAAPREQPQRANPPSAAPRPQRPEAPSQGGGQKRDAKPAPSQNRGEKARRK